MARKTKKDKEAEPEAAAVHEEPRRSDQERLKWAGVFVAAVALVAVGYAVGQAGSEDEVLFAGDLAGPGSVSVSDTAAFVPGQGVGQGQGRGRGAGGGMGAAVHSLGTGGMQGVQGAGGGMGMAAGGGMADGFGRGGGLGVGAGRGMGPGLGPDGSGFPGQGNIERVPGQGPYGQNFPGECPYGIYQVPEGGFDPSSVLAETGWLGVGVRQSAAGVVVVEVAEVSPAATVGFELDDVIVLFDGVPVETVGQFAQLVRFAGAGTEVELVVVRAGVEETVQVLLGSPPA